MQDSIDSVAKPLSQALPDLSLQVISFLEIGIYILMAASIYYMARKSLFTIRQTGVLERRTLTYQLLNISTFLIPGFIFLYGLTQVSKDSLFVSLLFFVIFSIVFGFSLVDPVKSILAAILITIRGDLKLGDYISLGETEGEVHSIGAFNILVITKNGSRTFIPTQKILNHPYEIHAKKGGPSILINVPSTKISKRNLEKLAHLCAFKRRGSDVRISTTEGFHKLSIEIVNREARPWVQKYFDKHI